MESSSPFAQLVVDKLRTGLDQATTANRGIGTLPYFGALGLTEAAQPPLAAPTAETSPCPTPPSQFHAHREAVTFLRRLDGRLGAAPTPSQVRATFRRLVRRFHPDQHTQASDSIRRGYVEQFRAVCDAYRYLTTASN